MLTSAIVLYVVRKSHGPVAVRGRISAHLSLEDVLHSQSTEPRKESADSIRHRKGWPDVRQHTSHFSTSWQTSPLSREPTIASIPHNDFHGAHRCSTSSNTKTPQNPKRPIPFPSTVHSYHPGPRSWTVKIPSTNGVFEDVAAPSARSSISRITRYIPRMSLFREVMRDEVCHIRSL